MAMSRQDKNNAVLSALGHPLRRQILRYLANNSNGGVSPSEMAEELKQPLPNLSYHVRLLAEAGVLKLVKIEPRRGAVEHYYIRTGNALDRRVADALQLIGKD